MSLISPRLKVRLRRIWRRLFRFMLPEIAEVQDARDRWNSLDACLMDQWWAAYTDRDYPECQRLMNVMDKNAVEYLKILNKNR